MGISSMFGWICLFAKHFSRHSSIFGKSKLMKEMRNFIIVICFCLIAPMVMCQVHDTAFSITRSETSMSKGHFLKLKINYCDKFTVVFSGFYRVLNDLLPASEDKAYLTDFLKSKGFKIVKSTSGQWEKGPRYLEIAMSKDNCNCTIFKLYYNNKMMKDGYYNFTVKEKLVCNEPVTGIGE